MGADHTKHHGDPTCLRGVEVETTSVNNFCETPKHIDSAPNRDTYIRVCIKRTSKSVGVKCAVGSDETSLKLANGSGPNLKHGPSGLNKLIEDIAKSPFNERPDPAEET